MNYYPICLNIDYKKVVIVGGGHVARQKLQSLLPTKAQVVIVSPTIVSEIQAYIEQGVATWHEKAFEASDLDGAALIFAVTNNEEVNDAVEQATQHWQLLSRADAKGHVDFINPAVVRRGEFMLTVSTSGASPSLTRKVKEDLAEVYDESYADYVTFLKEARLDLLEKSLDREVKKQALQALLTPEVLSWIRQGDTEKCQQFLQQLVQEEKTL
ncbi:NAD(P)-dependent oxidoreductase [Lysinibacillus sp. KU-BSD001]|uniref:precorrin-2 dehydrogenase/sirohydrochlorin ferrochelatase family protein n=1 Tax=Lysinibacillus sp. KU-BSD001 TaxID=3141328 RepID=UPI0036E7D2A3